MHEKGYKIKHKYAASLLAFLLLVLCAFSLFDLRSEAASKVVQTKTALNKSKLTLTTHRSYYLKLKNAKGKITWKSSDKSVARITSKGIVTAVSPGICTITVNNKGKRYTCVVKVLRTSYDTLKTVYPSSSKQNQGKILLAGSSTLDYWSNAADAFYPYEVHNMAIAGSKVTQWQKWYEQLIIPYKPKAVVIYIGTNDLARGTSWKNTVLAIRDLIEKIQKKLPETPIYYVSMCPCERRPGLWKDIIKCNKYMKKHCGCDKNLYYINLYPYFTHNGKPKASLFLEDKLHPNSNGYTFWKNVVAKTIKKNLKSKT